MWVLWSLLLLLGLLLLGLLFSPFELWLDTRSDIYALRWRGVISARLTGTAVDPVVRLWVVGLRWQIPLLKLMRPGKEGAAKKQGTNGPKKPKKKRKKGRPRWMTFRLALRLLRTFRVRELDWQLDTGDFVRNAYCFPLFYGLSKGSRRLAINFRGQNELTLRMTNRLASIGWVFLTGFLSPKNL